MQHILAAVIILFLSTLCQCGHPKPRPPRDHPKAIEAFRKLAKDGFKGDLKDIEAAFNECFEGNDRVSAFGDLFKTATCYEKRKLKDLENITLYVWEVTRGKDKILSLDVYVGLDPPVVVITQIKTFW